MLRDFAAFFSENPQESAQEFSGFESPRAAGGPLGHPLPRIKNFTTKMSRSKPSGSVSLELFAFEEFEPNPGIPVGLAPGIAGADPPGPGPGRSAHARHDQHDPSGDELGSDFPPPLSNRRGGANTIASAGLTPFFAFSLSTSI